MHEGLAWVQRWRGHEQRVEAIDFAHGALVAVPWRESLWGAQDGPEFEVTPHGLLWNPEGRTMLLTPEGIEWEQPVELLTAYGDLFISRDLSNAVWIHDVKTGQRRARLDATADEIQESAVGADEVVLLRLGEVRRFDLEGQLVESVRIHTAAALIFSRGRVIWCEHEVDEEGLVTRIHGSIRAEVRGHVVDGAANDEGWVWATSDPIRGDVAVFDVDGERTSVPVDHFSARCASDARTLLVHSVDGVVWRAGGRLQTAPLGARGALMLWDGFPIVLSDRRLVPLVGSAVPRWELLDERIEEVCATVRLREGNGPFEDANGAWWHNIRGDEVELPPAGTSVQLRIRTTELGSSVVSWRSGDAEDHEDDVLELRVASEPDPPAADRAIQDWLRMGGPKEDALVRLITDDDLRAEVAESGMVMDLAGWLPRYPLSRGIGHDGRVHRYLVLEWPVDGRNHVVREHVHSGEVEWLADSVQAFLHDRLPHRFENPKRRATVAPDWFRMAFVDPVIPRDRIVLLDDPLEQFLRLARAGDAAIEIRGLVTGGSLEFVSPEFIPIEDRVDAIAPIIEAFAHCVGRDPTPFLAWLAELRTGGELYRQLRLAGLHLTEAGINGGPYVGRVPLFHGSTEISLWAYPPTSTLGLYGGRDVPWYGGGDVPWFEEDALDLLLRLPDLPEGFPRAIDAPDHFACVFGDVSPPTREREMYARWWNGPWPVRPSWEEMLALYEELGWDAFTRAFRPRDPVD